MIIAGILAVMKAIYLFDFMMAVSLYVPLTVVFIALIWKNLLKAKFPSERDGLMHGVARMVFFSAMGILFVALVFRFMHWPGGWVLFLASMVMQLCGLVLSFVLKPTSPLRNNDDILDQE
jgi:hypothetical protein